ncbi:DUF998 domain-containing protein [Spongiactinospora sp. TRM90649]|uniref:DUF998 domain-containing protein n=1 Tax=Spongiactinospora sp. TRM90649 TaxID=3031114 RepID=UPI0023F679FC|nr:DUF998 domain-containing protein [Spongiactinospora sp. TRM90649]MDF5758992.1 DUF998 domain-containing protein [Spongiactinospora sp. TRM90649]
MLLMRGMYPLIACLGIVAAVVAMALGQIDADQRLDVLGSTIGEYAMAERGGATAFAMFSLGVAAIALLAGLRTAGAPVRGAPERLIGAWGGVMLVVAPVSLTLDGWIGEANRVVPIMSVMSFAVLPAAAGLLVSRFDGDERWRVLARPVEWLALAGGFGLLAAVYVALPGGGVMIGLAERAMLGVQVAFLGLLAVRLAALSTTGRRVAATLRTAYDTTITRADLADSRRRTILS